MTNFRSSLRAGFFFPSALCLGVLGLQTALFYLRCEFRLATFREKKGFGDVYWTSKSSPSMDVSSGDWDFSVVV